jgi:NADH-quinone oxidoreductase subunit J
MTLLGAVFYVISAAVVGSTLLAVTRRNPVHCIVFLTVSFAGTALLFYLLGAPLLAAFEVIIYAGAIMVLFLFMVMTMRLEGAEADEPQRLRWVGPAMAGGLGAVLVGVLIAADAGTGMGLQAALASPAGFARVLFERYGLAVEIVSVLLLVALVGALYLGARNGRSADTGDGEPS